MLYCGTSMNTWIKRALTYLPNDIFDKINGKIAFTTLKGNACRLAREICEYEDIIILSPWIFSYIPASSCETDKEGRYFIFCILHEVAHAVFNDLPPNKISEKENTDQEGKANKYALEWFNDYALEHRNKGLTDFTDFTIEEKKETEDRYETKLEPILNQS